MTGLARIRLAFLAAGVAAVIALGVVCALLARNYGAPFPGFLVYRSGAIASLWRGNWAGKQLGLRGRDTVIAVDGEPVSSGADFRRALEERRASATVRVTVVQPSSRLWPGRGAERTVTVPLGRLSHGDWAYVLILPFSVGLVYLLLACVVYGLKPTREAGLAAALCLLAAVFHLTMFDAHSTHRFTRLWQLYPFFGPLSVHLFALFPEERPGWTRPVVLLPLYVLALVVVGWRELTLDDAAASDRASLVSAILLSCEFTLDLGLLGDAMLRGSSPRVRNHAKSMFIGLGLTIGASVAWQFASRIGPPGLPMSADVAMVLSALFPVLITYAIVKRNLFDIDAMLRASLSWFLATLFVLGVYFAAVAAAGNVAARWAGNSTTAAVVATLTAVLLFHPVRLRAQGIVDRLWFRDPELLPELIALLGTLPRAVAGGLPQVARAAVGPLRRIARARGAALWVRADSGFVMEAGEGELGEPLSKWSAEDSLLDALARRGSAEALRDLAGATEADSVTYSRLVAMKIELLVPLVSKGALIGILGVGAPRAPARRYGASVLRALSTVAPQLALSLEHANLVAEGVLRDRLAALGQLAAVIVHEVKNPLGIIKVSAGALKRRTHDDDAAELASCIEDEVDRIDATVRRLLDLARPQKPNLGPCDLRSVIRETLERLSPDLQRAGILVEADLAAAGKVEADGEELRRALLNLLLNAREAMPGGGKLAVRLRERAAAVEIEIEDTGHGMDEATRSQLFRPFFTTRHGGTGLGLALVKRVIEDHQGAIRVESQPGQGARFTLTLPS
jgi:signal transduction histidine kinase